MRPNLYQLPVSGDSFGIRVPETRRLRWSEWIRLVSALIAATGLAYGKARADPGGPVVVGSDLVRVEAQVLEGRLVERYLGRRDGEWVQVAAGEEGGTIGPTAVILASHGVEAGTLARIGTDGPDLVEEFTAGGLRVLRKVAVDGGGPWVRVTTQLNPARPEQLHAFVDRFRFSQEPDWSFAPSVRGFVPDAQYKAPLILVQAGRVAFGIVPDVGGLDRATLRRCNHALDLDVPGGPVLSVGFMPARLAYHSVYAPDEARSWTAEAPLGNAYYLLVTATAPPGEAYREAVRLHWRRFGQAGQIRAAAQQAATDPHYLGLALWDDWRKAVWQVQSRSEWLKVPLPDGATGGGVATRRWGPGPSVYLSAWFNTLRTSYGMALNARRMGDGELLGMARETLDLALGAPGRDGAFKCIAVPGGRDRATVWAAGDGRGDSTEEGFLGYDMSWTAYWLLKWREAGLPGGEAVLPRCRALARFLTDRQAKDGMLPTRFREDGAVIGDLSETVKAETGPVALFLLELYLQDPDPRWLAAAKGGLAFLEGNVVKARQWYDFETFWSCSPRKPALDPRTRQWPANDLALGQAVSAYLAAYRATGDRAYLERGERLLDYLLLYQQCWTNPVLENLTGPEMLLGGFTTQNSDAEWSDARQSQVGNTLLDYYRATGKAEYLQRGVAALRAQFPVSPSENWAHEGYGRKAGVSSFHWGTGSGMAGIEMEEEYLRDAVVDVASGTGVGVNGLDVAECSVQGGEIRLRVASPFAWRRDAVIVFRQADTSRSYRVVVNGADLGVRRGTDLERGLPVRPCPE
jgi:hypothetical protein